MVASIGLIGRDQRPDVADDEPLARGNPEDALGIQARVGAGNDHRLRGCPVPLGPAAGAFPRPNMLLETAVPSMRGSPA